LDIKYYLGYYNATLDAENQAVVRLFAGAVLIINELQAANTMPNKRD
jgi:hypothetical protein